MTQQPWGPPPGQRPAQPPPPRGWNQAPPRSGWQSAPPAGSGWPGQPTWGQQTAPIIRSQPAPGGFGAPQRPQSNPAKTVLLAMTGLAVVALVALVAINLAGLGRSGEVAYENEDYQVPPESAQPPPLPDYPDTYEGAFAALEDNPLYAQQMPEPVRCELPAGNPPEMSEEELDAYFTEQMACLTRSWQPPLAAGGYTEVRPPVTIYRDQVTSACGNLEGDEAVNAFYCPADQGVYFSTLMFEFLPDLNQPNIAALVMAHEYGHNVQARANLMIPARLLQSDTDDEEVSLELSRRVEVQADCFAGSFLNSSAQSLGLTEEDFAAMEQSLVNIGDDTLTGDADVVGNHGRGASRELWGQRGWTNTDLAVCNTFTAPAEEVE